MYGVLGFWGYKPKPGDNNPGPPKDAGSYMQNMPHGSPGQARKRIDKNPNAHLVQQ